MTQKNAGHIFTFKYAEDVTAAPTLSFQGLHFPAIFHPN
jgi:hypothetical protein